MPGSEDRKPADSPPQFLALAALVALAGADREMAARAVPLTAGPSVAAILGAPAAPVAGPSPATPRAGDVTEPTKLEEIKPNSDHLHSQTIELKPI